MKKFGTLIMLFISLTVSAQSDYDIAQEFMSKKGIILKDNSRTRSLDKKKPYSIFNGKNNKGFVIVMNGRVVGYDTGNSANEDDIPSEFVSFLKQRTRTSTVERVVDPINPKLKIKWNQCSPYNDSLFGQTNICFILAQAAVLHYHKANYYVEKKGFEFSGVPMHLVPTIFDHELIDNKGADGWAEETAKFIKYSSLGTPWNRKPEEFKEIFGVEFYYAEHLDCNKSLYNVFDWLLERDCPIEVYAKNHGYVVDGRDSEGKYHVNFGWGGACDGYYVFPDTKNDVDTESLDDYDHINNLKYVIGYVKPDTNEALSIDSNSYIHSNRNTVYNLQGVKVGYSLEGLPKGVYIQGGKKYVK